MVFWKFTKFDENTAGRLGMNEGNFCVMSPGSGFLIDQRRSLLEIGLHLCFHIINLKTNMMDPWAFGL
jgi:hypothetical protein